MMVSISEETLSRITDRIVAALHPKRIYLFGSHAYGTPNSSSDIDLLVVVAHSNDRPIELDIRARAAIGSVDCGVDVITRTLDDFEHRASWPSNLEATIKSNGRLLYG